jgi:hypothetical protein
MNMEVVPTDAPVNMAAPSVVPGGDVDNVDAWISMLMDCKLLPENDIKKLCDKASRRMI